MPAGVLSGAVIMNGFLLVAVKLKGHVVSIENDVWKIDGIDITQLIEKMEVPTEAEWKNL